jgi:hypothetical protein
MIDPAILGRLRALAGNNFEELAGASFAAEIPLTNTVVNRLIAERLVAGSGPVSAVQVDAQDDDTFNAQVSLRPKIIPTIRIAARIEEQPEPQRPVLGVRWSMPGLGPLGLLAGPALSFLKALPRGLRTEHDRILVDVAELLRAQGLADLLPFISKVGIHTRRGAFVVTFELRASRAAGTDNQ